MSWKDDVGYIRSLSSYIYLSVLLFAGAGVLGYIAASRDPVFATAWMKELEMLRWILELSPPLIMMIIFLKNLLACAMAMLLGLGFGIFPLIVAVSNGMLLGIVSYSVVTTEGTLYLAAGILPHGIIELPTVIVCIAIGFRLGHLLLFSLQGKDVDLSGATRTALHFLVARAVPLLFLAAMIETFITPLVMSVMV